MSSIMESNPSNPNSQGSNATSSELHQISRLSVIDLGIRALQDAGSEHICKVCIANGGSCCNGCRHLVRGLGCQLRNTSCTAWLCGFLKYLLYETGHLQEWNYFWEQVPGQDYREDFTPEVVFVDNRLSIPSIRELSEALAADLEELARAHIAIGFIITLREKIDKNIDRLDTCRHDVKKQARIKRNIKILSSPFQRFHKALREYQLHGSPSL
ncbi:hypothetical protein K0T92_11725 [Paenibacillus oenotherae]|uniref:DNA mismatch repair protein n=1 Tax=Paenibacillus oenotherae TaxID=1435645 RepID=A0ABS7D6F1_9BACL|nr:hypothetical protein [Paenibacillus oenotherae]MBW7475419.1 hypothetical protein [Paenibacillus oenotherae]